MLSNTRKRNRVKFNLGLSVNRPSNNWAQNSKRNNSGFNKWLQIRDGEDLPPTLFWSKNAKLKFTVSNEEDDDSKKPRGRENIALHSEEEAVNKRQRTLTDS